MVVGTVVLVVVVEVVDGDGAGSITDDVITAIVDVVDNDVIIVRVVVVCGASTVVEIMVTEVGAGEMASEEVGTGVIDCTKLDGVVTSVAVGMSRSEGLVVVTSMITLTEDVVGTDSITDIMSVVCALDSSTANATNSRQTHLHCLVIVDILERSWSVWLQ